MVDVPLFHAPSKNGSVAVKMTPCKKRTIQKEDPHLPTPSGQVTSQLQEHHAPSCGNGSLAYTGQGVQVANHPTHMQPIGTGIFTYKKIVELKANVGNIPYIEGKKKEIMLQSQRLT